MIARSLLARPIRSPNLGSQDHNARTTYMISRNQVNSISRLRLHLEKNVRNCSKSSQGLYFYFQAIASSPRPNYARCINLVPLMVYIVIGIPLTFWFARTCGHLAHAGPSNTRITSKRDFSERVLEKTSKKEKHNTENTAGQLTCNHQRLTKV